MTRKHFIKLADVLRQNRESIYEDSFDALVSDIADLCEELNERFDRNKFYDAIYHSA